MSYNELKQHGTASFPFGLYRIDHTHPKYEMQHHWHAEHELIRVLSGVLHITLNNRPITAQAGDLLYINSEVVHGAVPENCVYECIVYTPQFLSMPQSDFFDGLIGHTLYINDYFPHTDRTADGLRDITDSVFLALREDGEGARYNVVGGFYRMLGWICGHHAYTGSLSMQNGGSRDEKNVQKLKHVLSFIRGAYDRPITLDDMAAAAGMSPQYFCTFFKQMTDKTPLAYVNAYRIERASRKLLGTDLSVTDIAYSCGFNDLSYFIKTFKAEKGMTPRAFRRGETESAGK
ncbi:MAG: AraC family transcriptional regulator [Clostridia bacterium]|nr:AraC family transcriptional regulator [Clostridia bacterium]